MRKALILLPLLLAGCGSLTRAQYESANALPILAEHEQDGTLLVIYGPDYDPCIDPMTGVYTCPIGVRVAKYRDGVLVQRYFEPSKKLPQ